MEPMQEAAQDPKVKPKGVEIPTLRETRQTVTNNVKAMPRELGQTLSAWFREGLKDLRDFFLNPWQEQPLAHTDEPGLPHNPPQYEAPSFNREPRDGGKPRDVWRTSADLPAPQIEGRVIEH